MGFTDFFNATANTRWTRPGCGDSVAVTASCTLFSFLDVAKQMPLNSLTLILELGHRKSR